MRQDGVSMTPDGYVQVAGFELNGNFFVSPDGDAANAVKAPNGFIRGKKSDVLEVSDADDVGRVYITDKNRGVKFLAKVITDDGEETSLGMYDNEIPQYKIEGNKKTLLSGNPMVSEMATGAGPGGVRFANMSKKDIRGYYRTIQFSTKALNVANEILPMIEDSVGPLNSVKSWVSNVIGPLAPDSWDNMVAYSKTVAGRSMMDRFARNLVQALALSDRFATAEQQIIYKKYAQDPDTFWQDEKMTTMKFADMMRTLQNEYNYAKASISDKPSFGFLSKLPEGNQNDLIIYSKPGHFDALAITAATAGGKDKLKGLYIKLTKEEAERLGLKASGSSLFQITGVDNLGNFQIR